MKNRSSHGGGVLGLEFESDTQELEGFEEIDPMAAVNNSGKQQRGNRLSNASNISTSSSRRNSLGLRRRSSFGGATKLSLLSSSEQTRVTDMYKQVIKLSSENKINEKNSWNFDLIDYMGSIIKEESSNQRGVNFQKASCTLDASVKIYSNRVDDTYTTSHRVLESLSRNGGPEEDVDDVDDDNAAGDNGDGETGKKKKKESRVGSKSASNRLQISDTIERNLDNINASHLEHESLVDPMFHLMSKAFDEGGAKGMLMANLRMPDNRCCILFNSCGTFDSANSDDSRGSAQINIAELLGATSISLAELSLPTICPPLETYRQALELKESSAGVISQDYYNNIVYSRDQNGPSMMSSNRNTVNFPDTDSNSFNNFASDDWGGDDDCGDYGFEAADGSTATTEIDEFGNCNFDDTQSAFKVKSNARKSLDAARSPSKQKIQWDIVNNATSFSSSSTTVSSSSSAASGSMMSEATDNSHAATLPDDLPWIDSSATLVAAAGPSAAASEVLQDYGYFDLFDSKNKGQGNDWAGAKHWKYATRSNKQSNAPVVATAAEANNNSNAMVEEGDESMVTSNAKQQKAPRAAAVKDKEKFLLNLRVAPDEALLSAPKNSYTTMLSSPAIEKMEQSAAQGEHLLPPDAHVSIRDLCRLYSSPKIIMPPPALQAIFEKMFSSMSISKNQKEVLLFGTNKIKSSSDILWRKSTGSAASLVAAGMQEAPHNEETGVWNDDSDDDHQDYYPQNDNNMSPPEALIDAASSASEGSGGMMDSSMMPISNSSTAAAPIFDFSNLVQANRKVEKIEVKYATVSKRVNVKKLKEDLWSHLDSTLNGSQDETVDELDENTNPNFKRKNGGQIIIKKGRGAPLDNCNDDDDDEEEEGNREKISMKEAITLMSENETQKEVTFPFYFICLLHLANEHNLKIENVNRSTMDDLIISNGEI